jgi:hypothetical protein
MRLVTVLGGYGVFASRISEALTRIPDCRVRIAGRNRVVGANLAHRLGADFCECSLEDVGSIRRAVEGSSLVIHAAGPFQKADYRVARSCLECNSHYIDLADAREFVAGIGQLHNAARERKLLVVSGVSSAPGITSALVDKLRWEFSQIEEIQIALSPGNQNPRGASTIGAVLSYLGRPIRVWQDGSWTNRPGWGDAKRLGFPAPVGRRRVHNCDVPDLELFPAFFAARTVRFYAGLELDFLNYLLSTCRHVVQLVPLNLPRHRRLFLNLSLMLYPLGSTHGSLAIWLRGNNRQGAPIERRLAIVTDYDGPATPTSAAIVLTRKILKVGPPRIGAFPCLGFFTLEEILSHLTPLGVWCAHGDETGWKRPP